MKKPVIMVSDKNWVVEPQKIARGLEFQCYEVEGLYFLFCIL